VARRPYRMDKRAAAAAETRQRIVEACFGLHVERGISATTMAEIAGRAGVGAGTLYHHFPTYEDMVATCTAHAATLLPLPGPETIEACADPAGRLEALVAAVFGFYGRAKGLALVRADRGRFAPVAAFFDAEEANRLSLVRLALTPAGANERTVRFVAALLDVGVFDRLRAAGFSTEAAADAVAATLAAGVLARGAIPAAKDEP